MLAEMHDRRAAKESRRGSISAAVRDIISRDGSVYSAADVKWACKEHHDMQKVSSKEIHAVLKEDHGLRYRRIQKAAPHLNSVRNLILRQQCVVAYLRQLNEGRNVITVDET